LVKKANKRIWDRSQQDASLRGMGTTCTLLFLGDDEGTVVHVGDSRLYLFREGALNQLSEDHTLVGQMVREGRLSEAEARHHPQRSIITRALGVDVDVQVDAFQVELRADDALLICSDGLSGMIDDEEIERVFREGTDAQTTADRLVELANEAGGEDNITAVVLDTRAEAVEASPPPPPARATAITDRDTGELGHPDEIANANASEESVDGEDDDAYRGGGSWRRRISIAVLAVVVLLVAAFFVLKYWLDNSYYVAPDTSGSVAIFQGVDGEFAGVDLSHVDHSYSLLVSELPENLRANVKNTLNAGSLSDAKNKVSSLQAAAKRYQAQLAKQRQHHKASKKSGGGGN
jgi:protein phosphatase